MLQYKDDYLEEYGNGCRKRRMVTGICFCGKEFKVSLDNLKRNTNSCGCTRFKYSHGMTGTRIYYIWSNMMQRCTNPKNEHYSDYGGRGIGLCKEWEVFNNFYTDMKTHYLSHLTIERINNDEGYSKQNCRWSTRFEQSRNKRNSIAFNGENAVEASFRLRGGVNLVQSRLKHGWSKEKAFSTPNTKTR